MATNVKLYQGCSKLKMPLQLAVYRYKEKKKKKKGNNKYIIQQVYSVKKERKKERN